MGRPASKWFVKDSMKTTCLSLKGRGKVELALKPLVVVVVPIHRLLLASPRDKVIVPVPSKLTNPMITMMMMRISPWKPSPLSSFGHPSLLVRPLKWGLSGW
jgi:hypothetical protein